MLLLPFMTKQLLMLKYFVNLKNRRFFHLPPNVRLVESSVYVLNSNRGGGLVNQLKQSISVAKMLR